MDINNPKLTNNIWELDRAMEEDPILHDQLPFTTILPNYPFQTYQISPSPPTQIPLSGVHLQDRVENSHHQQQQQQQQEVGEEEEPEEELGAMKEMMYKIAAMQPVDIDPATIHKPKRRNVRISDDPQSVAARHRRERISEKIRILQRLVPGGTKMDTASMLDEAIRYVKFLKRQIRKLQSNHHHHPPPYVGVGHVPARDWPITTSKTLGSTAEPPPVRPQYNFGGGGAGDPICFVHEVNGN